jgi:hypothetical protein
LGKIRRCRFNRFESELRKTGSDGVGSKGVMNCVPQAGDGRHWRTSRNEDAEVLQTFQRGIACFGERRHIREGNARAGSCGRKGSQPAGLHIRQQSADVTYARRQVTSDDVLNGPRSTLVWNMLELNPGSVGQSHAEEMRVCACTGGAVGRLPWILPAPRDEIPKRLHTRGHARTDGEQELRRADGCHGDKVVKRIVSEAAVERSRKSQT